MEQENYNYIFNVFCFINFCFVFFYPAKYLHFNALLAPTGEEETLGKKLGGYSSLAGIAGINISSERGSKSKEAIERIKSYDFFIEEFSHI